MPSGTPRLIYIASKLQNNTPQVPHQLTRFIPQYDLVASMVDGLHASSIKNEIPYSQLLAVAEEGITSDITPVAFKYAVAEMIMASPMLENLTLEERLRIFGATERWVAGKLDKTFETQEVDLGEVGEVEPIKYIETGFTPFDMCTKGVNDLAYIVLIGKTGVGKTSTSLTAARYIKKKSPTTRIIYFDIEIPMPLFLGRAKPILDEKIFTSKDTFYSGSTTIEQIIETVKGHHEQKGDNDIVVIIDSPDAMLSSGSDETGRRFALEHIYRQAVRLKSYCRQIWITSQSKRTDSDQVKIEDLAESWAKSFYADIIIGIWKTGNLYNMKTLKHRFGINGGSVKYIHNMADFTTDLPLDTGDEW